jgi:hypothetical protein
MQELFSLFNFFFKGKTTKLYLKANFAKLDSIIIFFFLSCFFLIKFFEK